jgi:hypothetical protein
MTTNKPQLNSLETYLNLMWHDYCLMTPEADAIYKILTESGEIVQNDHIALRTFNHPQLGIKSLAQHFLKYGYREAGEYFFNDKKLYAKHYENTNPDMPKIFISELEIDKMSSFVQDTLNRIVLKISPETILNEKFVFGGKTWDIEYKTYARLASESEYASWVYAFGFRPNHFTVRVNHLRKYSEMTHLNDFIKSNGYKLNASGGEIKGSPDALLEQSSTMAGVTSVEFKEGTYLIPACYYEFAKRYKMPNGQYYEGFIAQSADKIFESTNKQ